MDEAHQNDLSPALLTTNGVLAKNTLWNLLGQIAPLLVAVVAIPFLIKGLGVARFGVLMLALAFIGYFSIFDLGLGRALTKLVAEKLGEGRPEEIPGLIWTAMVLMACLGVLGAAVIVMIAPWLAQKALKVPSFLQNEAVGSFYIIGVSIPIVICTASLGGVLEAYQRFDLTNAIRIPMGLYTFLSPLIILPFTKNLIAIIVVLMVGRIVDLLAHLWLCFRVTPALRKITAHRSALRPLLTFGGWMTVTNIISPIMVYMDRFLIGVLVSMAAVAYYTTPHEIVIKLAVIPTALVGVLFPAFSTCLVEKRERAVMLFDRGANYIFLALFPITLVIVTLAGEGLEFWLGFEFAQNSTRVLQWLTIGVLINSLARMPFVFILAEGRPDITAKLHLIELPLYLLALWMLLPPFGIVGVAIAWVFRVALDTVILFVLVYRIEPLTAAPIHRLSTIVTAGLLILVLSANIKGLLLKTMFLLLTLVVFTPVAWFLLLEQEERHLLKGKLRLPSIFGR